MDNVSYILETHSTHHMSSYDIYVDCLSDCEQASFSLYTNVSNIDESLSNQCGDTVQISLPYSGFIRFNIPTDFQIDDNKGIALRYEIEGSEDKTFLEIDAILSNNKYNKPKLLSIVRNVLTKGENVHQNNYFTPFRIFDAEIIPNESDSPNEYVFSVDNKSDNDYIMVCSLENLPPQDTAKCFLFLAKKAYAQTEPVTVSYFNIYSKFSSDLFMTEVFDYIDGDIPGVHKSRDYFTIYYKSFCYGLSKSIIFPVDGARNVDLPIPGRHYTRLMQRYVDLCPNLVYYITDQKSEHDLCTPPAGYMYFIKANTLSSKVKLDAGSKSLCVMKFRSNSPIIGLFEQKLYSNASVTPYIANYTNKAIKNAIPNSIVNQFLYLCLTRLISNLAQDSNTFEKSSLVDRIEAYIDHNLCKNITVNSIAKNFNLSHSYVSHTFKEQNGYTIKNYICKQRMELAKHLLIESDKTVTELADELGYSDIFAFSHAFKIFTGVSPNEYRRYGGK